MYYKKARNFIYKNARPLDLARWKYLFENGRKEEVLIALKEYQNEDGGFGGGLEPDYLNPNSTPIQTWVATQIIREIELKNKNHPIIQGILSYLSSGKDFDGHTWLNTVPSNNDYPHAPWWHFEPTKEISYNPTASLIGFILRFAEKDSKIFEDACALAKEAYHYFMECIPKDSMHTVSCFISLYDDIKESAIDPLFDRQGFATRLQAYICQAITYDTSKWATNYVCKPSQFIKDKKSEFYVENKEICDYECGFIQDTQEADGSWNVTWSWSDYMEQWHISKNWWKSDLIIKNVQFIKEFKN